MKHLDFTLPSLAENLALDEAVLLHAEAGQGDEVLRFWEWQSPAVILGAGGRLADDVDEAACQQDGVTIWRRSSGGGTVLLGPGCLCYSLVLSYERDPALREIHSSFRFILGRIRDSLGPLTTHHSPPTSPGIALAGTSDLAVAGRKVSGNSQQRKRWFLLHHGTILHAFDPTLADRYLRMPARQPDYRCRRKHSEFLTNLEADPSGLRSLLSTAWHAIAVTSFWPKDTVRELVESKYERPEWIRRR
jgi:lipoate-protein ligase A